MANLRPSTPLEAAAGHPASSVGAAAGAALLGAVASSAAAGAVASAALPALVTCLAAGRFQRRVEESLQAINADLEGLAEEVRVMSDAQFKLLAEIINAVLRTTSTAKLELLRRSVRGAVLTGAGLRETEAALLGRVVRDITAEEASFLIAHFKYDFVELGGCAGEEDDEGSTVLQVDRASADGVVVSGLMALGLLIPAGPSWKEAGKVRFASLVAKVIALAGTADR
jgi:hypothetical protein